MEASIRTRLGFGTCPEAPEPVARPFRNAPPVSPGDHLRAPRRGGAQPAGVGDDAHAPEIEPVRIPARLHRHVVVEVAVRVAVAGLDEELEAGAVEGEVGVVAAPTA